MKGDVEGKLNPREQNDVHATLTFKLKNDHDVSTQKVQVVGIVNCTPDSFYDGGKYQEASEAIAHGKQLILAGAHWLDIGGESTRPGATDVSEQDELSRVLPVIEALSPLIPISIDTRKPEVAKQALAAGAQMLNDVSGFTDPQMCALAASSSALCCIVHAQGPPQTMQHDPRYPLGVVSEIYQFFEMTIQKLTGMGVDRKRLILDPGIGFGKSVQDNLTLIHHLEVFHTLGCPLYLGISRKSFLQRLIQKGVSHTLPATVICATVAVQRGVSYLRVHDVEEHCEMLAVLEHITT